MTENQPVAAPAATDTLYCAYHPGRETLLRCNRCGNPICYDCAVLTEVGYRCKQCVRQQQAVYFNGKTADPVVAAVVAIALGGLVGALAFMFLGALGFFSFIIAFFAGPAVGGMIAEAARQSVGRRRSRYLNIVVLVASLAGMVIGIALLFTMGGRNINFTTALGLVPAQVIRRWDLLLFAVLSSSTIYWRLR